MRTTLVIDDELYRRVKAKAAREGRTVTELVAFRKFEAEGLDLLLLEPEQERP